jgi:hypothetical protein
MPHQATTSPTFGPARCGYRDRMTQAPGEPISDGDAPTGDPDLADDEQPDPATEPHASDDQDDQEDHGDTHAH